MKTIILDESKITGTDSIQKIINSCAEETFLELIIKSGRYQIEPLILRSNMKLHLEKGCILKLTDNFSFYPPIYTRWEGIDCYAMRSGIFAENCSNIIISGSGIIDGQGQKWWKAYREIKNNKNSETLAEIRTQLLDLNKNITTASGGGGRETGFLRPSLIQIKNCEKVIIENIGLQNSPFWNTHILYSSKVDIKNVRFNNPANAPNTDGLDIDSSKDVNIEGCFFSVGDDCLCLKSGMETDKASVCGNVKIKNCTMKNGHGAVVFGSETSGGIENIDIENCFFNGTDRGIRLKTRRGRGGFIKNIHIKNIEMNSVISPIVVNMNYSCGAKPEELSFLSDTKPRPINKTTPVIENITIEDIAALNVTSSVGFFSGLPESPIKNIVVNNLEVEFNSKSPLNNPAMDFFNTKAESPAIILSNIENYNITNIEIKNYTGSIVKNESNR
ncbi:MAG: glycoside hydrolase family 28 protein [Spirochaetales bacterium]|nr:glycoside hydrolase family 28 protein [Spirochaetales bacterium]